MKRAKTWRGKGEEPENGVNTFLVPSKETWSSVDSCPLRTGKQRGNFQCFYICFLYAWSATLQRIGGERKVSKEAVFKLHCTSLLWDWCGWQLEMPAGEIIRAECCLDGTGGPTLLIHVWMRKSRSPQVTGHEHSFCLSKQDPASSMSFLIFLASLASRTLEHWKDTWKAGPAQPHGPTKLEARSSPKILSAFFIQASLRKMIVPSHLPTASGRKEWPPLFESCEQFQSLTCSFDKQRKGNNRWLTETFSTNPSL